MNELQVLDKRTILGGKFTIYGTPDDPLFVAKDVAEWIGHSNPTEMARTVDPEEKLNSTILSGGQRREVTLLTEDGLYEVLMQSRKPIAKQFKKQVKHILKDIRKHGIYATDNTIDKIIDNPEFGIRLLTELKAEREQRKALEQQVEQDKPKVIFADAVAASKTAILVGELAKLLKQNGVPNMGQNRLFAWLRDNGYLIRRKGTDYNMPTQYSMELGLFEVKETAVTHSDGHISVSKTPKVTGKGQAYFINKFLADQIIEGGELRDNRA